MKAKTRTQTSKQVGAAKLRLVTAGEASARPAAPPLTAEVKREVKRAAEAEAAAKKLRKPECVLDSGNKLAYNVREAAAALGVSEWYIRDEIGKKMLATTQARGRILIPRRELDRYIEENMTDASVDEQDAAAPDPGNTQRPCIDKRML